MMEIRRAQSLAWPRIAVLTVLLASQSLHWVSVTVAEEASGKSNEKMMWVPASDSKALCNDFTRAGFFIHRNPTSNNWIVFLEGGGLCYNADSCNRRFFVKKVRDAFMDTSISEVIPYGSFDPQRAWNETVVKGKDPARVISPLMSSMECFEGVQEYFPTGLNSSIEGRDILDVDPTKNPLFYDYNHVVVPYCSSDVWLGEDTRETPQCDCLTLASSSNPCFDFNPQSSNLQFTFRGKIIYQSILHQLLHNHGMMNANSVVVAGSSAGGIGAINHAKWTRENLNSSTQLMVLFDSSWFINFQDGIDQVFNGEMNNSQSLFAILQSQNDACNNTDRFGYPCCVSAQCIFTQQDGNGELLYYPRDTPSFAIFSIYDIYLLAPALASVANIQSSVNTGNGNAGLDIVLDFLRVAGEYGGIMNYTLDVVTAQESFLSYYVTQCFQHVYLATSTLWGEDGQTVFGSNIAEFMRGSASFRHTISYGRWSSLPLAATDMNVPATLLDALTVWVNASLNGSGLVQYTDTCYGVLCNRQCPDRLLLGELTSNNWHIGVKIFIVVLIIGIATICTFVKLMFTVWLHKMEKKLNYYLHSLYKMENPDHAKLQFPLCDDDNAVSVSCLDLHYSVTVFRENKALKDEKSDKTDPLVLHNLEEDETDSKEHKPNTINTIGRPVSIATLKRNIESLNVLNPEAGTTTTDVRHSFCGRFTKEILKGVSLYFNPGNMVGIMGPSGCGKTTLLDVLTGRRTTGTIKGSIYVNGSPVDEIREWYIANTGYVLQLALPYYEELTVRENLVLAAQLKLSNDYTLREKFERVEQVMEVTGLLSLSKVVVGGATGPGLSGGQKKRLVVALQLLNLPSVIFLDEPTSGLDATGSLELLTHLNKLAESNRTVILTIHQPRLEIFHMFHQLVLLSDGKVSYHDIPAKAYESFVSALTSKYLEKGLIIPSLVDVHNPADVIMDMLGSPKMRQIITENYQNSKEPKLVQRAIRRARWKKKNSESVESLSDALNFVVHGTKSTGKQASAFRRMAVLEARAAKRVSIGTLAFLPFIFFVFGVALGTVYIQVDKGLLVISGMCVFSTTSALFMFPAMYPYYLKALEVYRFERTDGVGKSYDLVIQGFVRFAFLALIPMIVAVAAIYFLLIEYRSYNVLVYLQVLVVNISLNQCWIALLIALICALPVRAFRLSPIIAAVAGFTSGFFIPIGTLNWGYRWLAYINPNYYGLSAVAFFVLSDFQTDCNGNRLECYINSGPYILNQFFFDEINPYLHLVVLFSFTMFYLLLATFANRVRHTTVAFKLKRISHLFRKLKKGLTLSDYNLEYGTYKQSSNFDAERDDKQTSEKHFSTLPDDDKKDSVEERGQRKGTLKVKRSQENAKDLEPGAENGTSATLDHDLNSTAVTATLSDDAEISDDEGSAHPYKFSRERVTFNCKGDTYHHVWRPKKQPHLPNLRQRKSVYNCTANPLFDKSTPRMPLFVRQQQLLDRVQATQAILKETTDDILESPGTKEPSISLREVSGRIIAEQRKCNKNQNRLSDIVTQYLLKMETEKAANASSSVDPQPLTSPGLPLQHSKRRLYKTQSTQGVLGAIRLEEWRKLMEEN